MNLIPLTVQQRNAALEREGTGWRVVASEQDDLAHLAYYPNGNPTETDCRQSIKPDQYADGALCDACLEANIKAGRIVSA